MDSKSPNRRPLAPTSINAILASPLPSPAKSSTPNTSLKLPPINLNPPINGERHIYALPPQSLPHFDDAISSALRKPLPTGLMSGSRRQPQPLSTTPPPSVATARPPPPLSTATLPAQPSKRKASEISTSSSHDTIVDDSDILDDRDVVRRKIHALINSGEMKVTEFVREISCNQNTYSRFMGQDGSDEGCGSEVYVKAWRFFKEREVYGIKPSVKKVRKEGEKNTDVSSIKLDGEDTMSVQVYDSCDEVRKKICAYLALPSVTQAGFLREIGKSYPVEGGKKIQSKVLNDFLGKKGKYIGNTRAVYYGSYVFFEKLRTRDRKEKSKHRTEMEREWMDQGGFNIKHRDNAKAYYLKGS